MSGFNPRPGHIRPLAAQLVPDIELQFYLPPYAMVGRKCDHGIPGCTIDKDRNVTIVGKGRLWVLRQAKALLTRLAPNRHEPVAGMIRRTDGPWMGVRIGLPARASAAMEPPRPWSLAR